MISQIVIPARNEAGRIGRLIETIADECTEDTRIIAVNNGSTDLTADEAAEAGADVTIEEPKIGKGFAVGAGLAVANPGPVFVCDADIEGLDQTMLRQLFEAYQASEAPVTRLAIDRAAESAPVTTLVAKPLLDILGYQSERIREPIGGLVLVDRDFVLGQHLPGGWGFDIALTLRVLELGLRLPEVRVNGVTHRQRALDGYVEMAKQVMHTALRVSGYIPWDHGDCVRCQDSTGKLALGNVAGHD